MKKSKVELRAEVESEFNGKSLKEINVYIKIHKFLLFMYKENTIFWMFFAIMMSLFVYRLIVNGPTNDVMFLGTSSSLLYLPTYHLIIKKIYHNRENDYNKIKGQLEVIVEYRDDKL